MSILQFSVEGLDLGLDVVDGELGFAPFVLSKDEQPFGLEGQRLKSTSQQKTRLSSTVGSGGGANGREMAFFPSRLGLNPAALWFRTAAVNLY